MALSGSHTLAKSVNRWLCLRNPCQTWEFVVFSDFCVKRTPLQQKSIVSSSSTFWKASFDPLHRSVIWFADVFTLIMFYLTVFGRSKSFVFFFIFMCLYVRLFIFFDVSAYHCINFIFTLSHFKKIFCIYQYFFIIIIIAA